METEKWVKWAALSCAAHLAHCSISSATSTLSTVYTPEVEQLYSRGRPLEDPHEEPRGLHGDLLVEVLKLEPHVDDVVPRLLGALTLEVEFPIFEVYCTDSKSVNMSLVY